jgi:hypothetical protein
VVVPALESNSTTENAKINRPLKIFWLNVYSIGVYGCSQYFQQYFCHCVVFFAVSDERNKSRRSKPALFC